MTSLAEQLQPAVAQSLASWHGMVQRKNFDGLPALIHPDAVFRSPVGHAPYHSVGALVLALSTVIQVFKDFEYHRQFVAADGLNVVLEFSARVGEKDLSGVDIIRFNAQGQIEEFEVMVRPLSALQALGAEMGARLAQTLPAYKSRG